MYIVPAIIVSIQFTQVCFYATFFITTQIHQQLVFYFPLFFHSLLIIFKNTCKTSIYFSSGKNLNQIYTHVFIEIFFFIFFISFKDFTIKVHMIFMNYLVSWKRFYEKLYSNVLRKKKKNLTIIILGDIVKRES